MDNFVLYFRNRHNTVTLKPFSYLAPSIKTSIIWCLCLLSIQSVLLFVSGSYASLVIIGCAVLGSLFADVLYNFIVKQGSVSWIISIVQGVVVGFLLPQTYNPMAVFFITLASMLLNKYAYGGFASSWSNPVAITVAVCFFLNMESFPSYLLSMESLQVRNPSLSLINQGIFEMYSFDSAITEFLNDTVFSFLGISIPEGYVSLFWDNGAVIPAFRFNFLTLVSSLFLFSFEMIDILIPMFFLFMYGVLVKVVSPFMVGGQAFQGDIILAFLTSGTLFSTLFMLQWYGTIPVTRSGKIIYGLLAGIVGFFILGCGTSPVGYVFVVLIMNLISPMIHVVESKNTRIKIERQLLPRLNAMRGEEHV